MNFVGTGQTLSGEDFARAAARIGCDEAAIRAVTFVEARGQGFDAKRRRLSDRRQAKMLRRERCGNRNCKTREKTCKTWPCFFRIKH